MRLFLYGGVMKKIISILISVLMLFCFCGCGEKEYTNVSYRCTGYFIGKCEKFKIIAICGERESPYIADGDAGDMMEFCVVSLKPVDANSGQKNYTFYITADGNEYAGVMNKDIFGTGFSKDVGKDLSESLSSIVVSDGEKEYPIELENMMSNAIISEKEALDISVNEFSEELTQMETNGEKSEIYVKFVCDTSGEESFYYWYVAHIKANGDYMAVLIDIVSGDVIAKRP